MFSLINLAQSTESCLQDKQISNNTIVHTGIGLTYEEAKYNLYTQLPNIGILQQLKLSTIKISNIATYAESNILRKDINVNFDHLVIYNCRIGGQYAITTLIPRDGISYLPKQHLKNIFDEPIFKKEYSTFAYAAKMCGSDVYTVLVSVNNDYEIVDAKKIIEQSMIGGVQTLVICGQFELKSNWFANKRISKNQSVFKNKYNMIYLGSYRSEPDVRDYSQELNLEMLKNTMR